MERHQLRPHRDHYESPRNNNPPVEDSLLSSDHYRVWHRLVTKSSRQFDSFLKFTLNVFIYGWDTASLVATLVFGVIIPDEREECAAALVLYVLTCVVTAAVNYANQRASVSYSRKSSAFHFLTNLLFFAKPVRYVKLWITRNKVRKILRDEDEVVSERGLKSMSELNARELEDKRVEMYECFFQGLPMAILQSYLLLQTHQGFQLCNLKDLARLGAIIIPLVHAAKSAANYESAVHNYEQTLHFLAYYQSRSQLPMVIYSSVMMSLNEFFNFVAHFFTILARFYVMSYFMSVSLCLPLLYLATLFLVNWAILQIAPQHLLEVFQNAPLGVFTRASYFADRLINVFANVGTRLNKFSNSPVCRFRVPLVLLQVLHFTIPLGVVYLTKFYYDMEPSEPEPAESATTLNSTLSSCPEFEKLYFLSTNPWYTKIGDLLFSSYKSLDDRFGTFNDVFEMGHMLWLVFYAQVLFTIVFGYADLMKRRKDPSTVTKSRESYFRDIYPILTGYAFYGTLLRNVLKRDVHSIRVLMLLTCLKEAEFYHLARIMGLCNRTHVNKETLKKWTAVVTGRLNVPDNNVEMKINVCIGSGHRFLNEFLVIRDKLMRGESDVERLEDLKLFLGFFAAFDKKVCLMSSDRVERIFGMMGVGVEKWMEEWGECWGTSCSKDRAEIVNDS